MSFNIADEFDRMMKEHPEVYQAFERFADELRRAGRTRGSSQQIIERIRWETRIRGGGTFKMNNWFRTCLAHELVRRRPEFAGFFEFRKRRKTA